MESLEIPAERSTDGRPLKLFVVGETSPDPEEWSELGGFSLVLARDTQEALKTIGYPDSYTAIEVKTDRPTVVCTIPIGGDEWE